MTLRVAISTEQDGFTYERVRFMADSDEALIRKLGEAVLGLLNEQNPAPALMVTIKRET